MGVVDHGMLDVDFHTLGAAGDECSHIFALTSDHPPFAVRKQ